MSETITYNDRYYLNKLVSLVNPSSCSLSATLKPNVPAFLSGIENYKSKEEYKEAFEEALKLYHLCSRHNILPFWGLCFDDREMCPKIQYFGPKNFGASFHSDPLRTCRYPVHFAKNNMWYAIHFTEYSGEKNVNEIKSAVDEFIKRGYVTDSFHLKIFRKEDIDIFCSDRKIIVYGEIPDKKALEELVAV